MEGHTGRNPRLRSELATVVRQRERWAHAFELTEISENHRWLSRTWPTIHLASKIHTEPESTYQIERGPDTPASISPQVIERN